MRVYDYILPLLLDTLLHLAVLPTSFCLGLMGYINSQGNLVCIRAGRIEAVRMCAWKNLLPLWHCCAVHQAHKSTRLRFPKESEQIYFRIPSETRGRASGCSISRSCILCTPYVYLSFCFAWIFVLLEMIVYICLKYFSKYSVVVDAALKSVKSESWTLISRTA